LSGRSVTTISPGAKSGGGAGLDHSIAARRRWVGSLGQVACPFPAAVCRSHLIVVAIAGAKLSILPAIIIFVDDLAAVVIACVVIACVVIAVVVVVVIAAVVLDDQAVPCQTRITDIQMNKRDRNKSKPKAQTG